MAVCAGCRGAVPNGARFCPFCGVPSLAIPKRLSTGAELAVADWGKVILGHELGEGGMGIVYRGYLYYDPKQRFAGTPPHPVAVKLLHPLLGGRERPRRLFLREAEALRRLSHPNVVHLFALSEDAGQLAIVMELVHGSPLSRVIADALPQRTSKAPPVLPFVRAWHYFAQLLGALAAVHNLGILHRDVKPANVLVRTDGVVKLSDFGIARIPQDNAQNTGGVAPGTGAYMSPEAVTGAELDPRSDLYAAGIVLYEMLSGRTPFDPGDRTELDVRRAQITEPVPPLSRLVTSTPPIVDALLARALEKDPKRRFGSALEFGEALRSALGLPAEAGWSAQQELAGIAKTVSEAALPAVPPTVPDPAERAEVLRADLLSAYSWKNPADRR